MKQRRFSRIAFVVFEINWLVTKKVTDFSPMQSYKKLLKKIVQVCSSRMPCTTN